MAVQSKFRAKASPTRRSISLAQSHSPAKVKVVSATGPRLDSDTVEFVSWSSAEISNFGRTIHYKGFSGLLDFEEDQTNAEKRSALEFFMEENPDTLVWDGDSYKSDSFTALIPEIYSNTHPRLVIFLRDTPDERRRVMESWNPLKLPITCYLLSEDLSYDKLGGEALEATQSKTVFCFGGGEVLEQDTVNSNVVAALGTPSAPTNIFASVSGGGVTINAFSVANAVEQLLVAPPASPMNTNGDSGWLWGASTLGSIGPLGTLIVAIVCILYYKRDAIGAYMNYKLKKQGGSHPGTGTRTASTNVQMHKTACPDNV